MLGFMLVAMPASFHHFDLDFSKRKHEKMRQLEGEYTNLASNKENMVTTLAQ